MSLTFYNTLSHDKQHFEPIDPGNVRMYVCGPTVYDLIHIGNARAVVVFDVLFRLLRHVYGEEAVTYVRNITDVDDKINERAAKKGISIQKLTRKTTEQFHEDIAALGVFPPTIEPRATQHIEQMITMISGLIEKGHAYEAGGHVLFAVGSDEDYGCLSHRSLEDMQAGARIEVASYKKDPMDFVLWKPSSGDQPGWKSPWGNGRPGWHIECSAMSAKYLGETFDIHGGGLDLVFPHHENEIAQSTCAHGNAVMANYWLHNGMLTVEGEKMSKSLGNFITLHEVLGQWPGEVVRMAMLMTHYRQPADWNMKTLTEARKTLDGWYELLEEAGLDTEKSEERGGPVSEKFLAALQDDLNTPKAISVLHELRREAVGGDSQAGRTFRDAARLVGLLSSSAREWKAWRPTQVALDDAAVEALVQARLDARAAKNWAEADRIRDELVEMGIVLKDGPEGTSWSYK